MDWGFTLAVVVTGIVVVFVVLTILVMLCESLGAFFSTENQATPIEKEAPQQKVVEQKTATSPPTPVVEEGISQEVVAAISASLAVIMGEENATYQISSIKKSNSNITDKRTSRTAWSNAGYIENTKLF